MRLELSLGRENLVLAVGLLGVLVIAAVVVPYGYYSAHPTSTRQAPLVGNIEVQSISVGIAGLNRTGLRLDVNSVVYNPNGFGATLVSLNYSVYANGHYLGSGRTDERYDLAPQSSLNLVFPISVSMESAFKTIGSYIVGWGHLTWEVKGDASILFGGISLSAPFEFTTG